MEDYKTSFSPQTQEKIVCHKCHKQVTPENGQQKNYGFICNECLAKSKRNKIIAVCAFLVCCTATAVTLFLIYGSEKSTVSGFEGVSAINDSVNVDMDSINVEFNLATATITSSPISAQAPVSNIEDFKRIVAQNMDAARSSDSNSLSIPVSSVQFGFNSAVLTADAQNLIREIVSLYNKTSMEKGVVIEGYACNIGGDAPNDFISQQRAEAVRDALMENGLTHGKISTQWFGKSKNSEYRLPSNDEYRRVLISIK